MPTYTVNTAWLTLTSSITDDNDIIRCLRIDPARQTMLGCDYTTMCIKMENDWRTFIQRAARVEQKKGYTKRCANALALQIVDEHGPATLLALLLSEFNVNANLKDTLGTYILTTALRSQITDNAMVLLIGCGKNKANRFCNDTQLAKSMIMDTVSLRSHRHFDPITGTHVDSTAFLLKTMLDAGASLHNTFTNVEDGGTPMDEDGLTIWCNVAHTGNTEVMKLLIGHSVEHNVHIDMNTMHDMETTRNGRKGLRVYGDRLITPLLFVTQNGASTEVGMPCVSCARDCSYTNCNMPMIKMLIANGANPHICVSVTWDVYVDPTKVKLSLCPEGRAQLGMAMYERVQSSRALVIWAMQGRFPSEVVALICTCAGIGEKRVADPNTPWIATMPVRTQCADSTWFGYYCGIDEMIQERKHT